MKKLAQIIASLMAVWLLLPAQAASANVNNFIITNFEVDYTLGRDSQNRSTLKVVETITAAFPETDQNKGLVREIPNEYDGHKLSFKLHSLQRNGQKEPVYNQYSQSKHQVVETGTDDYVHGEQVYRFEYTLADVTRYYDDTKRDEFYWDVNGTGWRVPIAKVSAKVRLDNDLAKATTGDNACYKGRYGSTERCLIVDNGSQYEVAATGLAPGENVSLAIGFQPGTFAAYEPSLLERLIEVWSVIAVATIPVGAVIIGWFSKRWYDWKYRNKELKPIAPEYLQPEASVLVAANVTPNYNASFAAQLVDLAVRHYIKIIETRPKSTWKSAEYDIEITKDITDLRNEEKELLTDIFNGDARPGSRLSLKSLNNNFGVSMRMMDNDTKLTKLVRGKYKIWTRNNTKQKWFKRAGIVSLVAAIVTLSPALLVAAIVAFSIGHSFWQLSDEGLALRRYMEGLKMYVSVAEAERLKILQSPEGAAKVPIDDPEDPAQIVKLYEKLLPYAMIFGKEKEWNKRLEEYYQTAKTQPDWISSTAGFNAAAFSSTMNSLSSAVSYTSASSSSSGGSGGGGFSGGGGGGGGGGGR